MGGRKITRVFITSILEWKIMEVSKSGEITMIDTEDLIHEGKLSFEKANKIVRNNSPGKQVALISIKEIEEEFVMDLKTFKKYATKQNAKSV